MVDVDISIIFAGLSIAASIAYYANVLRNANKTQQLQLETRQAQLFMTLFNTINNQNIWGLWSEIREYQFDDYDDFIEKYGPVNNPEAYDKMSKVLWLFTEMGVLVYRGYISMIDVVHLVALTPVMAWEKFGPVIEGFRGKRYSRRGHGSFEWLAKSMMAGVMSGGEDMLYFAEFHNSTPDVSISDYRIFLKEHPELVP